MGVEIPKNNMRKIIILSGILMFLGLSLTIYIVAKDIAESSREVEVDLSSPETMLVSLEDAIMKNSFIMLDKIFLEDHYSTIFGELFFDKPIHVTYGFSDDSELNQKRVVTSYDFSKIKKNQIMYMADYLAMAILMVDEVRPDALESESNVVKNLLNVAFLMQKINGEWQITKFYDFMTVDSSFLEIKDFNLHHINNNFEVDLTTIEYASGMQTTALYNFALSIDEISVYHDTLMLCNFTKDSISLFRGDEAIPLRNSTLFNPDILQIKGSCNYNTILSGNPEEKYLLYIKIRSDRGETYLRYYGDLLL